MSFNFLAMFSFFSSILLLWPYMSRVWLFYSFFIFNHGYFLLISTKEDEDLALWTPHVLFPFTSMYKLSQMSILWSYNLVVFLLFLCFSFLGIDNCLTFCLHSLPFTYSCINSSPQISVRVVKLLSIVSNIPGHFFLSLSITHICSRVLKN